ncbi:MAG: DUF262 domain-containing protein [Labilithrix sp.]|nr:DUF262 domain-containing protein [Labilithrix sp.]
MAEETKPGNGGAAAARIRTSARAESITVERLMELVSAGRVRMPKFQRDFKWEASDQRDLLDSIYRGYPVGTLLLWKNPPRGSEASRGLRGAAPTPDGELYLVVDGQQRITTLWNALGRKPEPKESALIFDMQKETFRSRPLTRDELEGLPPSGASEDQLPAVPVYLLLDAALLSEWVPQELSRETRRRYFDLGKQLREYQLAAYTVENADTEVLRIVFGRVNTSGKPMTRDEVFDAIVGSQVVEGDDAGLQLINASIKDIGFGAIDRSTLLSALEAIRGTKLGALDPQSLAAEQAAIELDRARSVLGIVVEFLRARAGVPHYLVCPYELPIVVLARFFALFPQPHERNLILLRRWFWRGSIAQRLGGASGTMQQHVDDIREHDEDGSVQRLLMRTGSPEGVVVDPNVTDRFSAASARGKAQLCALLAQSPRNLVTGARIEISELFANGSADVLRRILPGGDARGSSLAGKLLHPAVPTNVRRFVVGCEDEGSLMSHGIDATAMAALRADDAERFLESRAAILDRWIGTFFAGRAECERSDAPPLPSFARRTA